MAEATTEEGTQVTRVPVAYLRRSRVAENSPGDVSRDTQLAAIRAVAGEDGPSLTVFEDWGVSGRGKSRHKRTEFGRLLDLVTRDEVSTIYAYNLSRLGRSVRDVLELANLCAEHGTSIRLTDGQNVDASNATGRMLISILATVDEWQAEVQSERTTGVLEAWRAAHPDESLGRPRYGSDPKRPDESVDAVNAAFREAGSFLGAAKLLNARGVPTRLGKPWSVLSVSRIVRRTNPEIVRRVRQGQAAATRQMFAGLLHCNCGSVLTSMPRKYSVGWYCPVAHRDSAHPRPYVVSETKVRAWAQVQLDAMRTIVLQRGTLPDAAAIQARLATLEEKRGRIVDMFADGTIDKVARDRRLGVLAGDIAKTKASLDVRGPGKFLMRPSVDWSLPPDEINDQLLTVWQWVVMNGGMMPKRAVWVPCDDWTEEGPLP